MKEFSEATRYRLCRDKSNPSLCADWYSRYQVELCSHRDMRDRPLWLVHRFLNETLYKKANHIAIKLMNFTGISDTIFTGVSAGRAVLNFFGVEDEDKEAFEMVIKHDDPWFKAAYSLGRNAYWVKDKLDSMKSFSEKYADKKEKWACIAACLAMKFISVAPQCEDSLVARAMFAIDSKDSKEQSGNQDRLQKYVKGWLTDKILGPVKQAIELGVLTHFASEHASRSWKTRKTRNGDIPLGLSSDTLDCPALLNV